jgi:hypothetical protein
VIDEQEAKNVSDAQLPGRQCFWYWGLRARGEPSGACDFAGWYVWSDRAPQLQSERPRARPHARGRRRSCLWDDGRGRREL